MSKWWPDKFIIGLTGNIATGKSAVMRMAAERGALALDADKIVHDILDNDPSMQAAVAVAFGDHLRHRDGSINRALLASIVFDDAQALRDLELLLHPAVRLEIERRIGAGEEQIVVIEAIKLLEGELAALCDQIWVTRCSRRFQIQRLVVCRGMDGKTAATRVNAQNPQEAKVARADVVIDTEGTMAETREQFERAWTRVQRALPPRRNTTQDKSHSPQSPSPATQMTVATKKRTPDLPGAKTPDLADGAEVTVRRARPSDIPAILLLMRRASGDRIQTTRGEMLMSFSERSYLIAQIGADIVAVVGWNTDSTTAVCIDQIYAHPTQAIVTAGPPMLQEIERSARELICEVALAFLPEDAPVEFIRLLQGAGYEQMQLSQMRRAWQHTVKERQPREAVIMGKVLRDVRVA